MLNKQAKNKPFYCTYITRPTTIHKIFETNSSFHAKQRTTGKFLFFRRFLLVLTNFHCWRRTKQYTIVMRCAIWYHLYNLKNVKNTYGGVLILVKLHAKPATLLKLTFFHRCFSHFLNCTIGTISRKSPQLFYEVLIFS